MKFKINSKYFLQYICSELFKHIYEISFTLNGHGVTKDIQKAKDLFAGACEGEIEEACTELKKLNSQ